MSPYELDLIETELADKIVEQYEKEKKQIKERRFDYLKRKARALSAEIRDKECIKQKEERVKTMQRIHKSIANRMKIIIKGIDNKLIDIKTKPNDKFE